MWRFVQSNGCRAHPGSAPGPYVLISVSDTGHGMSRDTQERIFEPFFTTRREGEGTGMGLATVYGIVENHGGTVGVYSEEGQGTTFKVYLPLLPGTAAEIPSEKPGAIERGTGTILVVDDELTVRTSTTAMLIAMGYQVRTALNGQEAVDCYRERGHEIDLVIIDMTMPEMSGRECFAALREIDPNVRAILSSGYLKDERIQSMLDEGMHGFIQKPYLLSELSEAVSRVLRM